MHVSQADGQLLLWMCTLLVSQELVPNNKIGPAGQWLPIGGRDLVIDPIPPFSTHYSHYLEVVSLIPGDSINLISNLTLASLRNLIVISQPLFRFRQHLFYSTNKLYIDDLTSCN